MRTQKSSGTIVTKELAEQMVKRKKQEPAKKNKNGVVPGGDREKCQRVRNNDKGGKRRMS